MTPSRRAVLSLCALIIPLGLCLALVSILSSSTLPGAAAVVSVRGAPVTLYGVGVYRYNPIMLGAGYAAQDPVLIAALLSLGYCTVSLARGTDRALIPVLAALGYLTYVYASMALGAAFDWAYPAYVVLFSANVFALWFAAREGVQVLALQNVPHRWCLAGLFPWIVLATILQVRAGVIFSKAEIVGPITGFAVLGLGGAGFLYAAWQGAVARDPDRLSPDIVLP